MHAKLGHEILAARDIEVPVPSYQVELYQTTMYTVPVLIKKPGVESAPYIIQYWFFYVVLLAWTTEQALFNGIVGRIRLRKCHRACKT